MANIKIVTDSTSSIPQPLAQKLAIDIMPVNLILDGKRYREQIDISVEDFYRNFEKYETMSSEPVHYEDYVEKYKQVTRDHDQIIFIHCSKLMSDTYANGVKVHEALKNSHKCKVTMINSRTITMGLGFMVVAAAKAALKGRSHEAIVKLVEYCIPRTFIYLGVPNLKYLRRGKKISGLKSFVGSAMGMKPVLAVDEEGKNVVKSKIFGKKKNMMLEMLDQITEHVGNSQINLCIVHNGAIDLAEELRDVYSHRFNCKRSYIIYTTPAIGINTGPEATGIVYFKYD
jgi:DegV family protein with EDD domain